MDAHFLTEIEIEEFKCFKGFKTSGFKRVNLIGGKNNIGKTALIEAMFVNVHSKSVNKMTNSIHSIKTMRENINLLSTLVQGKGIDHIKILDSTRKYQSQSNLNEVYFEIIAMDAVKQYFFRINDVETAINANQFSLIFDFEPNVKFIDNFGFSDDGLIEVYKAIQKHDKEMELNGFIKEFDDALDNFKVMVDKPQCKTHGEYRDITEFGDGLKSYISMICALYACENGYLFIDEMDNGIHYTQLDRLWEIILTLSKQTNCQVFASTHSKEMIESFARVAKKLDEQEVSYTLLVKNKQQELATLVYDFEMLDYSMRMEHEVR